jgi:hypothetical protein
MENNISYSITNGTGPIKGKIDTSNTHIVDASQFTASDYPFGIFKIF